MSLTLKGTLKPGQPDKRYYMIRVMVAGRREVLSSGTRDKADALKREQRVVDALKADGNVAKEELLALVHGDREARRRIQVRSSEGLTLKEAFNRCWKDTKGWLRIKSKSTYLINTTAVLGALGADTPIAKIDREMLEDFAKTELAKGYATGTIDRKLACVGKMFNLAVNDWHILKHAPKMPYFNDKKSRKFVLSQEQEEALLDCLMKMQFLAPSSKGGRPRKMDGKDHVLLFIVLMEGGMRLGEALRIRWEDLVLTNDGGGLIRFWRTEESKNGEARTVPMTTACRTALEARRGRPVGPFHGMTKRRAQHLWSRAKQSVGITEKDCVIHSLRHTCATRLLEVVGDIKLVQEWLGHTTLETTAGIYAHVQTPRLMGAADALNRLRASGTSFSVTQQSKDRKR